MAFDIKIIRQTAVAYWQYFDIYFCSIFKSHHCRSSDTRWHVYTYFGYFRLIP